MASSDLIAVVADVNVWLDTILYLDKNIQLPPCGPGRADDARLCSATVFNWILQWQGCDICLYSDEPLLGVVKRKLMQPDAPELRPEDRGFGWSERRADHWIDSLNDAIDDDGRGCRVEPPPGERYLDQIEFEDRRVYGLFRTVVGAVPYAESVLISKDREFRTKANAEARAHGGRPLFVAAHPREFCEAMSRRHRAATSAR